MKLRTSFFNSRVLLKNLTRFAPVWALFAVGQVLGVISVDPVNNIGDLANSLCNVMGPVSIFHMCYAFLVAACLFGDLFDSRMCNGLHAMPMRREGWLLTHLVSGLVFALIPALVAGCLAALLLDSQWWLAFVWQGTSLLQYLFFFGLAVFCAMCAGKRIGMLAIFGILNFFAMLICWIADMIYAPLLPGVVLPVERLQIFSPVVSFFDHTYVDYSYDKILGGNFRGFVPEAWIYLGICAGIGVAFLLLAWLLYRKRHLETAGDFVSFRPVGSVFLLVYTLAMGVLIYSFGDIFGFYKNYAFLVVGILIGWFTGWMLLERTVKIFTKKVLIGFAAFAVLFGGSIVLTVMDPAGIAESIPQMDQIKEANLYLQNDVYYYHDEDNWGGRHITDPAEIQQVRELHSQMIDSHSDENGEYVTVYVRYRLQNNRVIYRTYKVPAISETAENLRPFFSDPRSVFNVDNWQQVKDTMQHMCVYWAGEKLPTELYTPEKMEALLSAIEADCYAGTFTQHDYFHTGMEYVAGVDLSWKEDAVDQDADPYEFTRGDHVVVYEDSINTVAFLKTLE